jgi:DNA-binding transcriptional regulator LsrR (DeoR family)
VFHAIVAGFIVTDPSTDPNNFFTYFGAESVLQIQASFVGLPAPGIIHSTEMANVRTISYMREAFDGVKDIDIIVTSAGGHWQEGHSSFYAMLKKASAETVKQLDDAGCIGDLMWRPLGRDGPLKIDTKMRTMTLLEPGDLPGFVKRNKTVILLLGPCGYCGKPKGDVLAAILAKKNLITHLVADSRSVREMLK